MAAVAYPRTGPDHAGARPVAAAGLRRAGAAERSAPARRRPTPSRRRAARRRGVVCAAAVVAAVALRWAPGWVAAERWVPPPRGTRVPAAAAGSGPAGARTYVVQPGDTLWAIARRLQPTGDLRPLVARLSRANGGTVVVPGQRVVLP